MRAGSVRPSMVALQSAMTQVLAEPPGDPRAAAELDVLLVLRSQLESALLARLADCDTPEVWAVDGSRNQSAWLRRRSGQSARASDDEVRLSRRIADHPLVERALATGQVTAAHAQVVCRALDSIGEDRWALQEPLFLDAAQLTDPVTLATDLRRRLAALAPLPAEHRAEAAHAARRVSLSRTPDGSWHLHGLLDSENGELLHTAMVAQRRTDHTADDTRTPGQRDADALTHLARLALDRGELAATHRLRPHLLILTPLDAVRDPHHGDSALSAATGVAGVAGVAGGAGGAGGAGYPCYLSGEPVTSRALRRLTCDAQLTRIVLDPAGLPVDVGRTQRTVPSQVWLAALARDRGCVADGCDQPPERCEAHHIVPFAHGGSTSLANTALLCVGANGHHHQIHDQARQVRTRHGRLIGPRGYVDDESA